MRVRASSSSDPARTTGLPPAGCARSTHHGADAGDQLTQAERLHHVVVGSQFEPDHAVGFLALGGDDDDRHVRALPQAPAHVVAVEVGKAQVEQNEVGRRSVQGILTGRDAPHTEPFAFQAFGERLRYRVLVLDDQHVHEPMVAPARRDGIGVLPLQIGVFPKL